MYQYLRAVVVSFFFQAEDGIRARNVTGVQTCALPISLQGAQPGEKIVPGCAPCRGSAAGCPGSSVSANPVGHPAVSPRTPSPDRLTCAGSLGRSEERRVGKGGGLRGAVERVGQKTGEP